MKKVEIYTDGACSGNPGPGGWAAILICGKSEKEISGYAENTTNNRMELQAVIEGLKALKSTEVEVIIYSDSAYVVNAFNQNWVSGWLKNNFKNIQKKEVINRDLWEELISLKNKYNVCFVKVKGHAGNEYNNRCDELAVAEIKKRQK